MSDEIYFYDIRALSSDLIWRTVAGFGDDKLKGTVSQMKATEDAYKEKFKGSPTVLDVYARIVDVKRKEMKMRSSKRSLKKLIFKIVWGLRDLFPTSFRMQISFPSAAGDGESWLPDGGEGMTICVYLRREITLADVCMVEEYITDISKKIPYPFKCKRIKDPDDETCIIVRFY